MVFGPPLARPTKAPDDRNRKVPATGVTMRNRPTQILVVLALILIAVLPAGASVEIPMQFVLQPGMPIEIVEADAYQSDEKDQTVACIGFINHGTLTATALKLRYFQVDAFGEVQTSDEMSITGDFAPGIPIKIRRSPISGLPNGYAAERCYNSYHYGSETRRVIVRVQKVLFSDGSIWTSPYYRLSTPMPTGSADRP